MTDDEALLAELGRQIQEALAKIINHPANHVTTAMAVDAVNKAILQSQASGLLPPFKLDPADIAISTGPRRSCHIVIKGAAAEFLTRHGMAGVL